MLWNCKVLKLIMDKMNEYDYDYDCDDDDDYEDDDDDHNPAQWL